MKTPEEIRNRLSELAKIASTEDSDMQSLIGAEVRLYLFQNTESPTARVGYTEFYREEVKRLTNYPTGICSRAIDTVLDLLGEIEEEKAWVKERKVC